MSDVTEQTASVAAREMVGRPRPRTTWLPERTARTAPPGKRPWRLLVALALLGAGFWAIADDIFTLTTDHALVTGYTIGLQSPIAGRVASLSAKQGALVQAGETLARIENDRTDPARVADLAGRLARAQAELGASRGALAAMETLAEELRGRQAAHLAVAGQWYAAQIRQAEGQLAAAEARVARTERDHARKERLSQSGFAATADLEQSRMDHAVALQQATAAKAQIAALRTQQAAVPRGIFLEMGNSGAAYAAQRLDEVRLRQAELRRNVESQAAEAAALAPLVAEAERFVAAEREADLAAPVAGMVWRVLAQEGERVSRGAAVAELVECRAAFVLAALPQARANGLQPGHPAQIKLDGASQDYAGTVVAVLGGAAASERGNLAAVPTQPRGGATLVRIALPESALTAGCPVGQQARVVLPPAGEGVFARLGALLH